MPKAYRAKFRRRRNNDGTYDSICPACFLSVGRGLKTELELACVEAEHDCPIVFLGEREGLRGHSKNKGDDALADAS